MNDNNLDFRDVKRNLTFDGDTAIIKRTQDIDDNFLDTLKGIRNAQDNAPIGDFHHVASIPVAIVEKWFAEGFNIYDKNVTLPEILKRIRAEDMTDLITTSRKI